VFASIPRLLAAANDKGGGWPQLIMVAPDEGAHRRLIETGGGR
jgi:hypothetical protein